MCCSVAIQCLARKMKLKENENKKLFKKIFECRCQLPVITQSRYLILSSHFSNRFHVIYETIFSDDANVQGLKYVAADKVIVIYILFSQVHVNFLRKTAEV